MLIRDKATMERFREGIKDGFIKILDAEFEVKSIKETRGDDGRWFMEVELVELLPVRPFHVPKPVTAAHIAALGADGSHTHEGAKP